MKKIMLSMLRSYALRRGIFSSQIASLASFYADYYENVNHDPITNGEYWLIDSLLNVCDFNLIDVGAHVGEYSSYFLDKNPSGISIALEPAPETFAQLRLNLERFIRNGQAFPLNLAASSSESTQTFYFSHLHSNGSTFSHSYVKGVQNIQEFEPISVNLIKLDNVIERLGIQANTIGMLKIDVEGHEKDVLLGAQNLLNGIGCVQIEYGIHNLYEKFLLEDIYQMWGDSFLVGRVMPRCIAVSDKYNPKWEDFKGRNIILINKSKAAHKVALAAMSLVKFM